MRDELSVLSAFLAVAEDRSFTKAARRLGVSPSALSHAIRGLEERIGVRLLARTTRSVAPTDAGEQLLSRLRPDLADIRAAMDQIAGLRDRPAGRVRLVTSRMAARMVLAPKLERFAREYPDVVLDVTTEEGRIDLVGEGFDAGIHLGEYLDRDMVAVRVSQDHRPAIVGSPGYFASRPKPTSPHDLTGHRCLNYRHGSAGIYRWEFDNGAQSLVVSVYGPLTVDDVEVLIRAAMDGIGLAFTLEEHATPYLESGALVRVLEDWCPPFAGYFLYYPSRTTDRCALGSHRRAPVVGAPCRGLDVGLEELVMIRMGHAGRGFIVAALSLMATAAYAQATAQAPPKPFEPVSGQAGKDVVWVPTPQATVDKMLELTHVTAADYLIDLGSGNGITVITAAKKGATAVGVEFNPEMVALAQRLAKEAGVSNKVTFIQGDLFEADLSKATVVTLFLLPEINIRLRPKLLDLKPGTRIASNTFTMGDWEPDVQETSAPCTSWCTALFWVVPAKVAGTWQLGQQTLTLTQQYQQVSGTLGSTPVTAGKLNGEEITFTAGTQQYTGHVNGTTMTGSGWSATRR